MDVLQHNLTGFTASSQALDTADTDVGLLGLNLLYAPPVPFLELIFVHGLRGGSRKTWSKTNNPFHYWPKEWLPRDPEFENVRIFSFGYDSNWGIRKESTLNLHDFGKSLLYEVLNSPEIERDGDTPIIFVGHSMGGLIIKKAYILANQDQGCKKLVERIHGLVFLATPHRGADSATLLKNVLKAVAHGPKAFVSDLERHSEALQSINDGFRHYANALELRSFYETVKTNLGVSSQLIVNIDSAVLGYHNEESALLNANHRNICKFDSPSDSNFITFRNSLASMTKNATRKGKLLLHR